MELENAHLYSTKKLLKIQLNYGDAKTHLQCFSWYSVILRWISEDFS